MAKKKRNLTWLYVLLFLIVAGLIAAAVMKGQRKSKGIEVETYEVAKRTIKETVSASGKVFPEVEVKVGSDVSGELVKVYVKEGDSVTVGQVLARIDPELYTSAVERGEAAVNSSMAQVATSRANRSNSQAAVEQAFAQKKQIEAQIVNARAIYTRNQQLYKEELISKADLESSQSSLRSLEANLESAKASIRSAEAGVRAADENIKAAEFNVQSAEASLKETKTSLSRTTIYAPMSGIISYQGKEKGEIVLGTTQMAGDVIFKIANLTSMEVQVDVSESDILRVEVGDEVEIEVDAYLGRTFTGKVTEIANSASNTTGTMSLNTDQVTNFVVKIIIDADSYKDLISPTKRFAFRPGMSASVEINTKTVTDVIVVPIQAVTMREIETEEDKVENEDNLKEVVFVVQADTVAMKTVETDVQDDSYIQVTKGVALGEKVVSGPYAAISKKLKAGKKVSLTTDKKKSK